MSSGRIRSSTCNLVNVVAMSGYSIVFMIVQLRQYHASDLCRRLVRTASHHLATFPFKYFSSSIIFPSGRDCIPKASAASDTSFLWTLNVPFLSQRSAGASSCFT